MLKFEEMQPTQPPVKMFVLRGTKKKDSDRGLVQVVEGVAYFNSNEGEELAVNELREVLAFMEKQEVVYIPGLPSVKEVLKQQKKSKYKRD